jgi:hypothetical protein
MPAQLGRHENEPFKLNGDAHHSVLRLRVKLRISRFRFFKQSGAQYSRERIFFTLLYVLTAIDKTVRWRERKGDEPLVLPPPHAMLRGGKLAVRQRLP